MFSFLSVPLLSALNWVNGFIGNYGWSIIALTFIINAAMFPLRHKSNVSMRKMQEIQPQVKAIQDRYTKLKVDRSRAAENEHRDDGALPPEGSQSRERLRADAAHLPGAARVLQPAVRSDRAARRAVHLVDSRPGGAGSVLRDADPDGRIAGAAAEDDADDGRRSGAAEDDAVHADPLHVPVHHVAERAWRCTGSRATCS